MYVGELLAYREARNMGTRECEGSVEFVSNVVGGGEGVVLVVCM